MPDETRPSKTSLKKQMHDLQDLGAALVALRADDLDRLELPERLRDAVLDARRMTKHEARRRQLQYIGKLMRTVDAEPIRERIAALDAVSRAEVAQLHRIEDWRERLLAQPQALDDFLALHPRADAQRLGALLRGVDEERAHGKPPRSFRLLFQLIRAIVASDSERETPPASRRPPPDL
jgi:ribosome-associated protein